MLLMLIVAALALGLAVGAAVLVARRSGRLAGLGMFLLAAAVFLCCLAALLYRHQG